MSLGLLRPGVDLRDVVWQRIIEGGCDDTERGAVIEQEARWRLGFMRGKSHMTMLVRVNDEDASVRFNLVKPASTDVASAASGSETSTTSSSTDVDDDAKTKTVAAAAAELAGGKTSVLMEEYTGVIKVTTAADGGGGGSGGGGSGVVVLMRGEARMRDMGFGTRIIGGRVMCGVLKGQVTRTLSDVVGVACDESTTALGLQ